MSYVRYEDINYNLLGQFFVILHTMCNRLLFDVFRGKFTVISVLIVVLTPTFASRITEVLNWKTLDFAFANEEDRRVSKERGHFIPENNIPLSIDRWHERLFFAVPRFKKGVPSTLNYIMFHDGNSKNQTFDSSKLIPYPNWEANHRESRNLTSITKLQIDSCDRLWALDTGEIEDNTEKPPSIQVYDLRSNMQIRYVVLKEKTDYNEESSFMSMVVDVTSANCEDAFLYIADSGHYGIVVYNFRTNETHIIKHNYLHFDPLFGDFTISGVNFQWQSGIFGMALSPLTRDNFRIMYFHPLASTTEFAVTTKVLQNRSLDFTKSNYDFKVMGSRGSGSQSGASSLDEETGVIFYSLIVKSGIGCWNTFRGEEYNERTIGLVAEDNSTLIYPSDVRVDKSGVLWILSNKLPVFLYSKLNPDDINFRVFKSPVRNAIKGTICDEM